MNTIIAKLTSRKFIAAMASLGSAHWLTANGHIADGVYSAVVMSTVAVYIAGNVYQKTNVRE